jgi:hypothetical protein
MLGQYQPFSTYHLPSAPILTVPIPNLPVNVAEKALESLSSLLPLRGGMKNVSFFSTQDKMTFLPFNLCMQISIESVYDTRHYYCAFFLNHVDSFVQTPQCKGDV